MEVIINILIVSVILNIRRFIVMCTDKFFFVNGSTAVRLGHIKNVLVGVLILQCTQKPIAHSSYDQVDNVYVVIIKLLFVYKANENSP